MQIAGLFTYHIVGKAALVVVWMTEYSGYNPFLIRQSFFGGLCIPFTGSNFQFAGLVQITVNALKNKIKNCTNRRDRVVVSGSDSD